MTVKSNRGFTWPNSARIAVVVTCLLENWSGDKGPPFSVQTTSLRPGTHDRAAMTWGTYGGRAGVWRLIKILDENQVPATFVANAHALELAPDAAEQMLKSGHEIAAHSYTQDTILAYLMPEEEAPHRTLRRHLQEAYRSAAEGLAQPGAGVERAHRGAGRRGGLPVVRRLQSDRPAVLRQESQRHGRGTAAHATSPTIVCFAAIRATGTRSTRTRSTISTRTSRRLSSTSRSHCHFGGRPLMAAQIDRILKYLRRLFRCLARAPRRLGAMGARQRHRRMDQPRPVFPAVVAILNR